jgi:hypothetical protein
LRGLGPHLPMYVSFPGRSLKPLLAPVPGGLLAKPSRKIRPGDGAPSTFREISCLCPARVGFCNFHSQMLQDCILERIGEDELGKPCNQHIGV